jgi:hypothetical protein
LGVLALAGVFAANQRRMRRRARGGSLEGISVVIPARDEEERIGRCLAALPAGVEVIVVDDGSRDRTAALAANAGARVVPAGGRPAGWTGKCWAAWRGASVAGGHLLVFLDADTVLEPGALEAVAAEARPGGLVSVITRYTMSSLTEPALMPAFVLLQVALWPHGALPLANGPLMAVRRDEYLELGGHRAIAGSAREDLDLARLYAAARRPVRLLRGADLAATHHYASAAQVLAAWRRLFYAYAGESLAVALAGIAGLGLVLLGPPLVLLAALLGGDRPAAAAAGAGCVLLVGLRVVVALRERQPLSSIIWHPITVLATLAAMSASVADGLAGRPPVWRGAQLGGEPR